ncbi:acetoacetate--CoA ligase [Pseudochryseolinea flava]|uniref:Acetoacetate--CoA ligase n=1 Tax=Pseudochryseolinea flava TaxID=2059302 RepID=A0A364XVF7_9BACT|nr:acetoacetate--CoA ligase [Pseudochryseolinea flava]RAV98101.1 acetoacetate--CoA ligase [Pseudochryseolinea flava]
MDARLLWTPSQKTKDESNLSHYTAWLAKHKELLFHDYHSLWQWSTEHPDNFWKSLWEYFDIQHEGTPSKVLSDDAMPYTQWFEGTKLNYAEHIFRRQTDENPAIIFGSEYSSLQEISWRELRERVAALQSFLFQQGVREGDTVAAYLPCIPDATIAFLAVNSIGAIWSSCSPDFGTSSVIDRFAQIKPKVLFAVDHYRYGGKSFEKDAVIAELVAAIPSISHTVVITATKTSTDIPNSTLWNDALQDKEHQLRFNRVPFSHPIWVLYSSGTTGLPKAITHSHGGILLEQLKYGTFHNDFKSGEKCFWYTTTGWMMWNYIHGALLAGSTMVLYDGSPGYPDLTALWKFSAKVGIHHFGTSAGFILANMKAGIKPSDFDLRALRSIGSTGSTLPPEGFAWVYENVKSDLWLASMSGGTDICSAFVGGNPTWPVYEGEIQCRALGVKLEAYDEDGKSIQHTMGEMVITQPMPSMPIFFWNDLNHQRYLESYFEMYAGIWRHGDWIEITPQQGVIIYGRSDATLNRGGIRIGTSEIYRAVDQVKEVKDSLIICIEKAGGEFWMPLFVMMQEGTPLTDDIKKKINNTIRSAYSPRHVPDEIIAVKDIPYTISGKKTETPVKKILMGKDPKKVVNAGSLRNPEAMTFFVELLGDR